MINQDKDLEKLKAEFEEAKKKYVELGTQLREAQLSGLNAAIAAKKAAEEAIRAEVNKLGYYYGTIWNRFVN